VNKKEFFYESSRNEGEEKKESVKERAASKVRDAPFCIGNENR